MGFFSSTPEKIQQMPRFNSQQQQAFSDILQQALGGMQPQNFGSKFAPIAQQARTQFKESTIPSIMERFSGMGAGAQDSSAFAQILGRAGAGLEENLASQQAQYGLQEQQLLQQLLGLGLTPQNENIFRPREPGFLEKLLLSLAPAAGKAAGAYMGMPI